jgi:AraC family transcriptional regulator
MASHPNAILDPPTVTPWHEQVRGFAVGKPLSIEAVQILDEVRLALAHDLNAAAAGALRLAALLGSTAVERLQLSRAKGGLAPWQRRNVLSYIDSRLDKPISNKSLADAASLSVSYFCSAFKDSFGSTPHTYLIRTRLKRARDLMLRTREPLCQIALSCGFADQAHLSKLFRREMGQSPNVWRRFHITERSLSRGGALAVSSHRCLSGDAVEATAPMVTALARCDRRTA